MWDNFKNLTQSSPPGQHISTPPQADPNDSSRKPTFIIMTVSLRSPQVLNSNTIQHLNAPTHHLNAPTHHLNAPTHPLNAPTHHLNAPGHPLTHQLIFSISTHQRIVSTHQLNLSTITDTTTISKTPRTQTPKATKRRLVIWICPFNPF